MTSMVESVREMIDTRPLGVELTKGSHRIIFTTDLLNPIHRKVWIPIWIEINFQVWEDKRTEVEKWS